MNYVYEDVSALGVLLGMLPALTLPALFGMVSYVLSSWARYTLANRRGIHNPWLAWVPVAQNWVTGSLSDQYRYVALGQNRSKRKSLLTLGVITSLAGVIEVVMLVSMFVKVFVGALGGYSEEYLVQSMLGTVMGMMGLALVLAAVSIAYAIIYYMALYDIYKSMEPGNCVLFLVLSIIFRVTEPFFLFFNRNKDLGMPPRREQPVYTAQETWQP